MNIFDNLCRSCNISKDKLLNIYDIQQSAKFVKSMLEYCLQTAIRNESKYPKFICYDCLQQLEISYRFIKRFHLSQNEFEESYSRLQKIGDTTEDCLPQGAVVDTCYYDELKTKSNTFEVLKNSSVTKNISFDIDIHVECENYADINDSNCQEVPSQSEKSPAMCLLCNKTFLTKKALNLHTKLSHKQKT